MNMRRQRPHGVVIPAEAGIQCRPIEPLGPRFRGDDKSAGM